MGKWKNAGKEAWVRKAWGWRCCCSRSGSCWSYRNRIACQSEGTYGVEECVLSAGSSLLSFLYGWSNRTNHRADFGTCRDGCAHGNRGPDTERTTEWTERRGNAAGDGQVPLCVFGQGLSPLTVTLLPRMSFETVADRKHAGAIRALPHWSSPNLSARVLV